MKHLVIYCHPNPKSFNHAILEVYSNELKSKGHEVRVRDLYALDFDPVLKPQDFELMQKGQVSSDVKLEQEQIQWAQIITFISPIWWAGFPSRLKGYIDRVFSYGFAYKIDKEGIKGELADKKVLILNTTGTPENVYQVTGMFKSLNQIMEQGIFQFCGMAIVEHKYFAGVPSVSDEDRKKMLDEVKKVAQKL